MFSIWPCGNWWYVVNGKILFEDIVKRNDWWRVGMWCIMFDEKETSDEVRVWIVWKGNYWWNARLCVSSDDVSNGCETFDGREESSL